MAGEAPPLVAVVVLSWNARDDTLACLRSLARSDYPRLVTVVVDNASSDGSAEAVAAAFPDAELVANEHNLGYAGGMNRGIERALALGADHVLVLNNDTEVDPNAVTALVEEAERRPDAGALCAKVLYWEPRDVIWYAGARFDPVRGYNGRVTGHGERDSERFGRVAETERAAGTAMLVPRRVLADVGLFDERLFAYAEDTDWSLRARAAGYSLLVVPASRVWHRVSLASGGENSPGPMYYNVRNLLAVCEQHAPLGPLGTWRRRAVLVGAHLVQAVRSRSRRAAVAAVVAGWRDFRRGRFGARPA